MLDKRNLYLISNFINLNQQVKDYITNNCNYIIYEHDHKYLRSRNPALFKEYRAPKEEIINEKFLPVEPIEDDGKNTLVDYIFEPNQEEILNELIPNSLKIKFYKALLDSFASEHGARMTAMHKATDNATEMKKELTLFYNKARQASITNEILEIVAGAEALGA